MNRKYPVYTAQTQCQDCYKCVRECHVKAIRVENHHASVLTEYCVSCGHCVDVCPAGAKHIRDDLSRLKLMLKAKEQIFVSLAPSWVCEFPGIKTQAIIAAFKQLGFAGVSETALGAEMVSHKITEMLRGQRGGMYISSACPSAVEYIRCYRPDLCSNLTSLLSPLLAHARMLKAELGAHARVVFFGPCVAKKLEADNNTEILDLALTFSDLRQLLSEANIDINAIEPDSDKWLVGQAGCGHYYPVEGGMNRTITDVPDAELICISGIDRFNEELGGLVQLSQERAVFIELLACSGGCVNGPGMTNRVEAGLSRKIRVLSQQSVGDQYFNFGDIDIKAVFERSFLAVNSFSDYEVKKALATVDKRSHSDELNCGGCGYETCREFAYAMLNGNAEPDMCVSFMRNKAQNKANALLRCMPSGVVIVNSKLEIMECNKPFAEMFDEDTRLAFDSINTLEGANVNHVVPFAGLFRLALHTGEDICRQRYVAGDKIFNLTIFSIQTGQIVGAVIQDVTEIQWQRQQIAQKAREVLRKNLATVQNIACSLGEHMADTEVLLNSIANSYTDGSEEAGKNG
ncbi:MAG: 4Fe-4S binding protein [Sedimentisphaerales bacterium]|nr:4Fe-4S binding protein [Sedimentisphaerales bacterium]MBN2843873.1 4Fe-4S binding protein [Sedimentisphaerales bacterium]